VGFSGDGGKGYPEKREYSPLHSVSAEGRISPTFLEIVAGIGKNTANA